MFTIAVFSRALIFSPHHFSPQVIGTFDADLNGSKQKNEVWINSGSMMESQKELTQDWLKDGWAPVAQGMDFAPTLLGLDNAPDVLAPYLQMKMFEKDGVYRFLSLLQDSEKDQTYGWVSETPKKILDPSQALSHWEFPLMPPKNPSKLYLQKCMNCQMAFIFMSQNTDLTGVFKTSCANQDFDLIPLSRSNDRLSFMLKKGKIRILAMLDYGENENLISLLYFPKN
jgi:hypothetical protein